VVLQFDLPARRMEREERLLAMNNGDVNETLFDIAQEGGGKDARFLLAHGADANLEYGLEVGQEWPVLSWAARHGQLAVVEALLDAGAGELGKALGLWRQQR
jgi:ankyrin repeat protein